MNFQVNKAIFFDRDGIINKSLIHNRLPYPPNNLDEFILTPGIFDILTKLKTDEFFILVFTNQPDVSRGTQQKNMIDLFHRIILKELPIDKIYACYHDNSDNCNCRKPRPGMIFQGQVDYNLDLNKCWVIGDRWKDIEAGYNAGCKTIFLDYDYLEPKPTNSNYNISSLKNILPIIQKNKNLFEK